MATHVSAAPRRGFPWGVLAVLVGLVLIVALVGGAFAAGRDSASQRTTTPVQARGDIEPRLGNMMPWMQAHIADIAWMQKHMGDVTWMRSHWNQWQWTQGHPGDVRWMQTHPAQWQWMQAHMGDIGWMHDHWGEWDRWHSGMTGPGHHLGSGSNGPSTGSNGPDDGMGMG